MEGPQQPGQAQIRQLTLGDSISSKMKTRYVSVNLSSKSIAVSNTCVPKCSYCDRIKSNGYFCVTDPKWLDRVFR
jgi:hypothetical protein